MIQIMTGSNTNHMTFEVYPDREPEYELELAIITITAGGIINEIEW